MQPFCQADGSHPRKQGNWLDHLGAVCGNDGRNHLAESEPGQWSTFRFTAQFARVRADVPGRACPQVAEPSDAAQPGVGAR